MTPARGDRSLASLLLVQRLVDADAEPLRPKEFWAVLDSVGEPERLLGLDQAGLAALGLAPGVASRIAGRMIPAAALAFELERLAQSGIHVLSPFDEGYPECYRSRLRDGAPGILHVVGESSLLSGEGVGVVGSRRASAETLAAASDVAAEAARRGRTLVSGGAKGVDMAATAAALEAGGAAVAVLADSLASRLREPETRRLVMDGRLCLCTPYKPTAGFSVANAMGRNRLVYGLCDIVLVVASDEGRGGTWEGAVEALRGRFDVAVWQGAGSGTGNRALVAKGGRAASSIEEVFTPPAPGGEQPDSTPQLSFDV